MKNMENNITKPHPTFKQLYRKPESLTYPFYLTLQNKDVVKCEKLLRLLPKKRIVLQGKWKDKTVIIKLFIQPGRAAIHFARELSGINALIDSNTPTPFLHFHGKTEHYQIPILIMDYLENAKTLDASDPALMQAFILELATQHVSGILQTDLHFGNFLIKDNQIYSIDGDNIEYFNAPLLRKPSLTHLALFFSQLSVGTHALQQKLLATYAHARGWRLKKTDMAYLNKAIYRNRKDRLQHYHKKVLRTSSRTRFFALFGTRIWYDICETPSALLSELANPETLLQKAVLIKKGRSATLGRVQVGKQTFIIKRYNLKNIWHRLRRCLRKTRAQHCWGYAHCLELAGIATAKPIACIEKHFFGLSGRSYYIMEYVAGKDIAEYFYNYSPADPKFNSLAEKVARLIAALRELHLTHGDLKASNVLIRDEQPILIDLDGIKKGNSHQKDLKRFMKNWQYQRDVTDLFQEKFIATLKQGYDA